MGTYIKPRQKKNDIIAAQAEKKYVEHNLTYYINKNKKTSRINIGGSWAIKEDHDTILKQQFLEFTMEHFTLYELYVVFFNPNSCPIPFSNIYNARSEAIANINMDSSFTYKEARQLKRKVWDMHPLFFGLIQEFINNSELFWDKDLNKIVYPHYKVVYK